MSHPSSRGRSLLGRMAGSGGALLAILLLPFGPGRAACQSVHGHVLVEGDTVAVSGADLVLTDSAGSVVARVQATDAGEFRLPAPGPGRYRIQASRLGYATVSADVRLGDREVLEIELRMATEAIPLEPLVVVARRQIQQGTLDEFYDRMARMKQAGKGQFLTKEQLERRTSMPLPLLLQTLPGVWMEGSGGAVSLLNPSPSGGTFCTPEFYLDGIPMLGGYREIHVLDLEGVEVYRGYSEAIHGYFPSACGMIFLWRKPDWGNPFSLGRLFLVIGLAAAAFGVGALLF